VILLDSEGVMTRKKGKWITMRKKDKLLEKEKKPGRRTESILSDNQGIINARGE